MVNHLNWFLGSVILGMMDLPPAPASRGRNGTPLMIWLTHSYVLKAWLNYQFFQHSNAELQSTLCVPEWVHYLVISTTVDRGVSAVVPFPGML